MYFEVILGGFSGILGNCAQCACFVLRFAVRSAAYWIFAVFMCVCACACACVCVCVCVCLCVCVHVYMYACMHVCMYACMHSCMYDEADTAIVCAHT